MAEAGQPTGQVQIGLDATQFKAGTQQILSDIRSIMQGLANFERAASRTGGSLKGIEDASRSLKTFRSVVDGDALPALRRLQNQATASAASLSRVFQVGAQPNQAVAGINRVTTALAAQERQALRTADAMARAATASNRGAMAFRNGGRSSSGTSGRSVAGSTRGARSSLDDSGAAARRTYRQADLLFARIGKLTGGKGTSTWPFRDMPDPRNDPKQAWRFATPSPAQQAANRRHMAEIDRRFQAEIKRRGGWKAVYAARDEDDEMFSRREHLARKGKLRTSALTKSELRAAEQRRVSRSSGWTTERVTGTASLEDAARMYARALARSNAAGVRVRYADPTSTRGQNIASSAERQLRETLEALEAAPNRNRPRALRGYSNINRSGMLMSALEQIVDSGRLVRFAQRRLGSSAGRDIAHSGWIADAPNPYTRSSIPGIRRQKRLIVGAMSPHQLMGSRETGYLGSLAGVGAPGVGASLIAREIKRRARAGRALPLTAVPEALQMYLRGSFGHGPSGKRRVTARYAENQLNWGELTKLGLSAADAKRLVKLIRTSLPEAEREIGLAPGTVKYAKKGKLGALAKMGEKAIAQRKEGYAHHLQTRGTASVQDAAERFIRSLIRSTTSGVKVRSFGSRDLRAESSGSGRHTTYDRPMSARQKGEIRRMINLVEDLGTYGGGFYRKPGRARGGQDKFYKPRVMGGLDITTGDNQSALGMMASALQDAYYGHKPANIAMAPNPFYKARGVPRTISRHKYIPVGAYSSSTYGGTHGYLGGLTGIPGTEFGGGSGPLGGVGGSLVAHELRRRDRFRRTAIGRTERFQMTARGSQMSPYSGLGQLEMYGISGAGGAYEGMGMETIGTTGRPEPIRAGRRMASQRYVMTPWRNAQLMRRIRSRLPNVIDELRAQGEFIPDIRFAKKGTLSPIAAMQQKVIEKRAASSGGNRGVLSPGTAPVGQGASRFIRSLVRSRAAGVKYTEYGSPTGLKELVDWSDPNTDWDRTKTTLRQREQINKALKWLQTLRQYTTGNLRRPFAQQRDGRGEYYKYRPVPGFDPTTRDNMSSAAMMGHALQSIYYGSPGQVGWAPNPYYRKPGYPKALAAPKWIPAGAYFPSVGEDTHGYLGAFTGTTRGWGGRGAPLGGVGGTLIARELRRRHRFFGRMGPDTQQNMLAHYSGGFGKLEMFGIADALPAYMGLSGQKNLGPHGVEDFLPGQDLYNEDNYVAWDPKRIKDLMRLIRKGLPRGLAKYGMPGGMRFAQRGILGSNNIGLEAILAAESSRTSAVDDVQSGTYIPRTASIEDAARTIARGIVHSQMRGVSVHRVPHGATDLPREASGILSDISFSRNDKLIEAFYGGGGRGGMLHLALEKLVSGYRGGFIATMADRLSRPGEQFPYLPVGAYSTRDPGEFGGGYVGTIARAGAPGIGSALFGAEIKRRIAMARMDAMGLARSRFADPEGQMEHYRSILPGMIPPLDVTATDEGKGFYSLLGFQDRGFQSIGGTSVERVPSGLSLSGPRQFAMLSRIRQHIRYLEEQYGLPANSIRFAKRSSLGSVAASAGVRGKGGDSTVGATSKRGFEPLAAAIDTALTTYIKDMLQGLKAGRNGTIGPRQVAKALGKFQEDILSSFGVGSGKGIAGLRTGFEALPADSRRKISKSISEMFGNLLADYSEKMAPALGRRGVRMTSLTGRGHKSDLRQILYGSQGVLREELAATQSAFTPQRRRSGFAVPTPSASRYRTTPPGGGLEFVNGLPVRNNDVFNSPGILEAVQRASRGQGAYNNALVSLMLGQQFMPRMPEHYGSMDITDLSKFGAYGVASMDTSKNRRGGAPGRGFGYMAVDPGGSISHTVTLFNTVKTTLHEIEHIREELARQKSVAATGQTSGPAYEKHMKKLGFGSGELLPVYNPSSGEFMYIPKGGKIKIKEELQTPLGNVPGRVILPQGSMGTSQYKALPIKERGNYERAMITLAQASLIDKNAQGSHVNVQRHFVPQARMGAESGFGIAQMASLLAFSNQPLLPGETQEQADLRSRLTNTGFFRGAESRAVLRTSGVNAVRAGLEGTANSYIGGALPAYQQVMRGPAKLAANFGARVQAGLADAVTKMEAGGDDFQIIGKAAKALIQATQAIPAKDLQKTFGALSRTALPDFAMIIDAAARSGRRLTEAVPLGAAPVSSEREMIYGDPNQAQRGAGRRKKGGATTPAATPPGASPMVSALTPEGLQAISAALHALTLSTAGVSAAGLPQARANVRQARVGGLGLPEKVTPQMSAVRESLSLATLAAEVGAMPEGPHKEALKGMLRPYMPNNPLFGIQPGTRTGRGRRAGVATSNVSGGTAIIPAPEPVADLASIQNAIFGESFGYVAGSGGGGRPRQPNIPPRNLLPDFSAIDNLQAPSFKQIATDMGNYVKNSRVGLAVTQEFSEAVNKARAGTLNFGGALKTISDSSKGLLFTVKDTIKFATAITLTQNAAGAISQSIGHLTGGFIEFNSILEQARVGFTTLFKQGGDSMEIAESRSAGMIERMKEFANITPFRFPQLEEAAIRMKAFGLEMSNIIRRDSSGQLVGYMRSIGDAVAALGGGDERIMRITYALGQMNSAGRVYQNDMMQLANAGIAGYEILAEKLIAELEAKGEAMTNDDKKILNDLYSNRIEAIRRLTSKGAISGKGAVQAIMAGLGERYGGGMERLAKTMAGAFSTIADMSQSLVATMTGPLYNAIRDIVVQLSEYLQGNEILAYFMKLRENMSGFAATVRTAIPAAAKIAGDSLNFFLGMLQKIFGSGDGIMGGVNTLKDGLRTLADLMSNDVVKAMVLSAVAAKALMSALTSNPLVVTVTAIVALLGTMRQAYETNFLGIRDTIDALAPRMQEIANVIEEVIVPAVLGFAKGAGAFITTTLSAAIKIFGPMIAGIASGFSSVSGILANLSPILGFIVAMMVTKKLAVEGFALAFVKLSDAVARASAQMSVFGANAKYTGTKAVVGTNLGMVAVDSKTGEMSPLADKAKIDPHAGGDGGIVSGKQILTPGILRGATFASGYGPVPMPGGSVTRDLAGNVIAREAMLGPTQYTTLGATMSTDLFAEKGIQEIQRIRNEQLRLGQTVIVPGLNEASRFANQDELEKFIASGGTGPMPGAAQAASLGLGDLRITDEGRIKLAHEAKAVRKQNAANKGISISQYEREYAAKAEAGKFRSEPVFDAEGNMVDPGGRLLVPARMMAPEHLTPEEQQAELDRITREKIASEPEGGTYAERLRRLQEDRAQKARERIAARRPSLATPEGRARAAMPTRLSARTAISTFSTEGESATGVIPGSPRLRGVRGVQEYLKQLGTRMWTLGRRKVTRYDQAQFSTERGIGPVGPIPGSLRIPTDGSPIPLGAFQTELGPVGKIRKYLSTLTGARAPISAFSTEAVPGAPALQPRRIGERYSLSAFSTEGDKLPSRFQLLKEGIGDRARAIGGGLKDRLTAFTSYYKDKHGANAMNAAAASASAFATAAGATTMALGGLVGVINADLGATISKVGAGLLGFGQIVSMASAAMAQIGKMGLRNMVSSLTNFMTGPLGIAAAVGAVALSIYSLNEATKAAAAEMKKNVDALRVQREEIATQVAEKVGFGVPVASGEAAYRLYGMTSSGENIDKKVTAEEMAKLVAQGLFKENINPLLTPGQPGYTTYTPTSEGYKAGYISSDYLTTDYVAPFQTTLPNAEQQAAFTSATEGFMKGFGVTAYDEKKKRIQEAFASGIIKPGELEQLQTQYSTELAQLSELTAGALPGGQEFTPEMLAKLQTATAEFAAKWGQSGVTVDQSGFITGITNDTYNAAIDALYKKITPLDAAGMQSEVTKQYGAGYKIGDYGKQGLIDEGIFGTAEKIKLLNDSLEDAQKQAQDAAKRLNELFDPFATAFEQFMARAMKIVQEVFKQEQDQLAAEKSDALGNVMALNNGEQIRLGLLQEQYDTLVEQRKEQERLKALAAAQEAAARATLGLFDAEVDPIEAAIAAREAGQKLAEEEQNYAMDSMALAIDQAKNSTEYAKTEEFYAQRKRQLDEDQEERQRRIQERAQQLLKDIKEGKITPQKAQQEFFNMFGDVGVNLQDILQTGELGGESLATTFGESFVSAFSKLGATITSTMANVVRAGVNAAVAEANIDAIVAKLDQINKAEDKIKGQKILDEKARMAQIVKDTKFVLQLKAQTSDPETAAKIQQYIGQLDIAAAKMNTMPKIDPNVDYMRKDFDSAFKDIYAAFTALYDDFGALPTIVKTSPTPGGPGGWGGGARGGQIGLGQYIVGERGPEMLQMYPGGGGNIIPNHKLPASMRSSYGALKAGNGLGYQGRASGGYVNPFDDDRWNISPQSSFENALPYLNDPAGFQQQSFNDFMRDPNNTSAMKNELARRFPKNYAAYVRGQISSGTGGRYGFGRSRMGAIGRALGGAIPMDGGVPVDPEPPIVEPPVIPPVIPPVVVPPVVTPTCPIGTVPRWDPVKQEYTCVPADWMWPEFGTPDLPIPRALLLDARAYMLANNEMPWQVKEGTWSKIKGAVTRAYAPFGPGKGGSVDILNNSGYLNPSKASSYGGPRFGGQQAAVVSGKTGWAKRGGWLAKLPGLGPVGQWLRQPFRPLEHLKTGQLGTMLREGMPQTTAKSKIGRNRWIPRGMNQKGPLAMFFRNGNLMDRAALKLYPWLKYGSAAISAALTAYDIYEQQQMGADYWQKELNRIQTENTIEAWWKDNRQHYLPTSLLNNPYMNLQTGGVSMLEEGYKKAAIEKALAANAIKFPPPIVLNDEERAYFESSKEPIARGLFRGGGAGLGMAIGGLITAALGVASGGLALPAALAIGGVTSAVGSAAGGSLYDILFGTNTPFHQVRGLGNSNDIGLLATIGRIGGLGSDIMGALIGAIMDLVSGKKPTKKPVIRKNLHYAQGVFDPELLAQGMDGAAMKAQYYRPEDIKLPNPPGGVLKNNYALIAAGYVPRWYAQWEDEGIPGIRGSQTYYDVMPAGWTPDSLQGKIPGKAFGGAIAKHMPYLVGERGPELMIPNNSGYMLPNTGLRALQAPGDLRAAGGGATINASVTINNPVVSDAADIDKLAEKVSAAQVRTLRAAGFMRPS